MHEQSPADRTWATAIVVPCYNEAERLDLDSFLEFVASRRWLQFVFVDDGSTDETGALIAAAMRQEPGRIDCLSLARNSGKAEAVRRGVVSAMTGGRRLVGFWDADLATPLADIDEFRALMQASPDLQIVMGSRVKLLGRHIERSELRHYLGRVAATAASRILGIPVYDTQCGAKLFRVNPVLSRVFTERFLSRWAFDVEILARWLIHRDAGVDFNRAIVEVPLQQWINVPGSKLQTNDFVRAPIDLWSIWRRYGSALRERRRRDARIGSS